MYERLKLKRQKEKLLYSVAVWSCLAVALLGLSLPLSVQASEDEVNACDVIATAGTHAQGVLDQSGYILPHPREEAQVSEEQIIQLIDPVKNEEVSAQAVFVDNLYANQMLGIFKDVLTDHPMEYCGQPYRVAIAILDSGIEEGPYNFNGQEVYPFQDRIVSFKHRANEHRDQEALTAGEEVGEGRDRQGHGTHVAGSAAADIEGVNLGICTRCDVFDLGVLDENNKGSYTWIEEALNDIQHTLTLNPNLNMVLVNMSIAGYHSPDLLPKTLTERMESLLLTNRVLFVISAGNEGDVPTSPADLWPERPGMVVVGSLNERFEISGFSNTGPNVDVFAPGSDIVSLNSRNANKGESGAFVEKSGTSMSAPEVSGLLGLLAIARPELTAFELEDLFYEQFAYLNTATPHNLNDRYIEAYGNLNLYTKNVAFWLPEADTPMRKSDKRFIFPISFKQGRPVVEQSVE